MNKVLVSLAAIGATLIFFGCAKKKEAPAVEPPPPPEVEEEAAIIQPPPPPPSAPQEDPLEAERRRLEALMNRIMSDDVYFEFDKFTLTSQAKDILTRVGDVLKVENRFAITVEGHTDERGTAEYNLGLGTRRADAVVRFLINYGVASNRLKPQTLGKEQPKSIGHTEEDYAQNRRAAFRVSINR